MKKTAILCFLILSLSSLLFIPVYADIEKEYLVERPGGYTFKVTVLVQTEEDNTWIVGEGYEVHYSLIVTEVDSSIHSSGFEMRSWSYGGMSTLFANTTIISNQTTASQFVTGSLYYIMSSDRERTIPFYPFLQWDATSDYWEPFGYERSYWIADSPIYIDVVFPSENTSPIPLLYLVVGVTIGAIMVISLTLWFSRNKRNSK